MSIKTQLERIIGLRDTLRIRLRNMGLVSQDADLEECVYALRSIEIHGYTFTPIESFDDWITISPGYYPEGSVVGIASVDQADFIPDNIRSGRSILGVDGSFTSDATATAANILSGKTAYVKGEKITGTIPSQAAKTITPSTSAQTAVSAGVYTTEAVTVAAMPVGALNSPVIGINRSTGEITATAGVGTAGYLSQNAAATGKRTLLTQGATAFTPGTSDQTIASGTYLTGTQTIKGDSNLKAANIRKGVAIFGVTGTYEAVGTSDFTPSSGATVNLRPSGQLDGTSVWCNYAIKPVGYTSDYAIFEYTLTAGLGSTSANTGSGHEEYTALIRFSGTNVSERTYCIIVKSWNTAWNSGSTASRFTETGYFAVPITGTPSIVSILVRCKTTAVSNVASATGTVTF